MIASYRKNADGTVTFLNEFGTPELNAPADHPIVAQKIQELNAKPPPSTMALNMPGQSGMGPAVQNGQISPTMALGQMGLNVPDPTSIDRQRIAGGQWQPPPGQYVPPPPDQKGSSSRKPFAQPFGPGSSAGGLEGGASRGIHAIGNAIGGRILAARDEKEKADNPYDRFTQLAGQAGTQAPMDPVEQKAYEDAHARMAKAREEEARAMAPGAPIPPPVPMRKPMGGERVDPATGAVLPDVQSDEDRIKEEEREGA